MTRWVARAPVRVDFGGGWTDVPPYPEEQGGAVASLAVAHRVTATIDLTAPPDPPHETSPLVRAVRDHFGLDRGRITLETDIPPGSGLGGSSAATVALVAAASHAVGGPLAGDALAVRSRQIEVDGAGIAGGWQDHFPAAMGGALALEFGRRIAARPLALSPVAARALEAGCAIWHTGASRLSAENIAAVLDAYRRRDPGVVASLAAMARLARAMSDPLADGDVAALGHLVGEHWLHQRALHPAITTPRIDLMIATALRLGAYGAKALGASGGGCVIVLAPPARWPAIGAALDQLAERLPFRIAATGCEVRS